MDLVFATKAVRSICESQSKARRFLGEKACELLRHRLSDIEAASDGVELRAALAPVSSASPSGHISIELDDGYVLMVAPADIPSPQKDMDPDWKKVKRLMILEISKK